MPLDPTLEALLQQMNAAPGPKLHELSPSEAREFFSSMQLPSEPIELPHVENRSLPGPAGEIPVRVYKPSTEDGLPVLVYFHGGGWVIGDLDTHDGTCRELAQGAGCAVVSVDYRRAPEAPYPAAAEDCYTATTWVAANAAALDVDASRIAIGGDSAGGNLTAVVAQMARDRKGPGLALQLLIYPVTDADFARGSYDENGEGFFLETDAMKWFWDQYVPDVSQRREPYAAPLRAERLEGLPPALVQTAEFDPLRDEGEAYAAQLKSAGVDTTLTRYDGMIHGFFAMSALAQGARDAVAEASEALRNAFTR